MPQPSKRLLRRARREREALLLDLGTLVFDLHREQRRAPELLQALAAELERVDEEVRRLEAGGRDEPGGRPRWAAAAAVAALCVAAIGVGVVVLTGSDSEDGETTIAAGSSGPVATGGRPADAEAGPPVDESADRGGEILGVEESGGDPGAPALAAWPAGQTGHTVIVLTAGDAPSARSVAREAEAGGLDAGVLRSDDYDLGEGLWLVFAGSYESPEQAAAAADELAERYPGAYPQAIAPTG